MNTKEGKLISFWVERLTFPDICWFGFRSLFCDAVIYYDKEQISALAKRVLEKFRFLGNFYPLKLTMGSKDESGYSINYIFEDYFYDCLELFCSRHIPAESVSFKNMVKQYLAFYLYYRIVFITMAENTAEFRDNNKDRRPIFYLSNSPLNKVIIPYFKGRGYLLQQSLVSWQSIKYFLRPFYFTLSIFFARFRHKNNSTNIVNLRPSIWVEYVHDKTIDFAFWGDYIRKDYDVVYYFDRDDDGPIAEMTKDVEKRGFKWVNLHFQSLLGLSKIGFSDLMKLFGSFIFSNKSFLWFRIFSFEYTMWFLLYRAVYERFEVKALMQHQEMSWVQEPQVQALEKNGGIMIGFHWGSLCFYKEPILNPMHVLFVWGKLNGDSFKRKGTTCKHILPSGFWLVDTKNDYRELEDFSKKFDFLIAIFDNSIRYNVTLTAETLKEFYSLGLELIEGNVKWGGIIKSKRWRLSDLPLDDGIKARMQRLVDDGRLIILDKSVYTSVAARYADISVCYGLTSSGIISGIHRTPFVQWDPNGCLQHPFFNDKDQKFVYLDLESLKTAVMEYSRGNLSIGDFSRWRKNLNHFDDSNAPRRVGEFINNFMDSVVSGKAADSSLEESVKRYISENMAGDSSFDAGNMWQ